MTRGYRMLSCRIAALVAVATAFVATAVAQPPPDREARIAALVRASESQRQAAIKSHPARVKQAEAQLAAMRKATIGKPPARRKPGTYHFANKEEKDAAIAKQQGTIEQVKEGKEKLEANDPPFVPTIDALERLLIVGEIGLLPPATLEVVRVEDEKSVLVRRIFTVTVPRSKQGAIYYDKKPRGQMMRVKGIATAGLKEGSELEVAQCVEVTDSGTFEDETGIKTIVVVEPFDPTPHLKAGATGEGGGGPKKPVIKKPGK